ncbi:MAG: hypothetical protein ACKVI6_03295 [Candidatus Poseidoniales archaeon]|jgi:RNase P subunit RPR2|tara:strand:- start:2608 stop:2946 length:339 start_codon:yes stop_codon:yes gene_type:complete
MINMPIRRGGKKSRIRKQNAAKSVEFLSSILKNNLDHNSITLDSAARSILLIGKKHGIRTNIETNRKICRNCKSSLMPGTTSRVRFSNGFILNTCISCGKTHRFKLNRNSGE